MLPGPWHWRPGVVSASAEDLDFAIDIAVASAYRIAEGELRALWRFRHSLLATSPRWQLAASPRGTARGPTALKEVILAGGLFHTQSS